MLCIDILSSIHNSRMLCLCTLIEDATGKEITIVRICICDGVEGITTTMIMMLMMTMMVLMMIMITIVSNNDH